MVTDGKLGKIRIAATVLSLSAGLVALSCNGGDTPEQGSEDEVESGTTTPVPSLSDEERGVLQALFRSTPELQPTVLDHSNPEHDLLFRALARLGGKTPENSPQFFRTLDEARRRHLESGPADPKRVYLTGVEASSQESEGTLPVGPVQAITSFGRTSAPSGLEYQASAISSVNGQPTFSYMSITITDENGNTQGPTFQQTQSLAGEEIVGSTQATLDPTDQAAKLVMTYSWQEQNGTFHSGILGVTTSNVPRQINPGNPEDKTNDGMIKICWGRSGADCDYNPQGGSANNAILPINGSIVYNGTIETPINPNPGGNAFSSITISRPTPEQGGGCNLITNTVDFFSKATVSGNTVTWNLDPAHFTNPSGCLQPNTFANYTFVLRLTVAGLPTTVAISSAPDTISGPFTVKLPRTAVYFSCVAEGTEITLADGLRKKVEDVNALDRLLAHRDGTVLSVKSTLIGVEDIPMVRLVTGGGHDLLLTEGHPVVTASGVRLARYLEVGDLVETLDGPSPLISVTREMFGGNVHNFNVGTEHEKMAIGKNDTTFFANGILVGDNEMQFHFGRLDQMPASTSFDIDRLPKEWHQDYLNELARRAP